MFVFVQFTARHTEDRFVVSRYAHETRAST